MSENENEVTEIAEVTADSVPDTAFIRLLHGQTYRVMGHLITKDDYTKVTNKKLIAHCMNAVTDVNVGSDDEITKEWRPLFDVKPGESAPVVKAPAARARGRASA